MTSKNVAVGISNIVECEECINQLDQIFSKDTTKGLSRITKGNEKHGTYYIIELDLSESQDTIDFMHTEVLPKIEKEICHIVRIALLSNDDEFILFIVPNNDNDKE